MFAVLSTTLFFHYNYYCFLPWFVYIVIEHLLFCIGTYFAIHLYLYYCPGIIYKGIHPFESSVKEVMSGNKSIREKQLVNQCLMKKFYLYFSLLINSHLLYMLCVIYD